MKLRIIYFVFLITVPAYGAAQKPEQINRSDAKGLKQGHWIKKNANGHIIYDGYFRDNIPVGAFKRFYDNDTIQSVLVYSSDRKTAEATFYHPNGYIASKGQYTDRMKEGRWIFYSARIRDYLICEEVYLHNMKNGVSLKYYPDKTISERLTYDNDTRTGGWTQYYPDGQVCLSGNYSSGKLDGKFVIYYENGKPEFSGQYTNNSREGDWIRYNRDGSVKSTINFSAGVATNPDYYKKESEYLDAIEKNKGKIEDPEKTGTIWQ